MPSRLPHSTYGTCYLQTFRPAHQSVLYKMLSYLRETALQGALVSDKSGRLELENNILWTLQVYRQPP